MSTLTEEESVQVITFTLNVFTGGKNDTPSFLNHVGLDKSKILPLWLEHYQREDGTHDGAKALQDIVAWPLMTRIIFDTLISAERQNTDG